MNSRQYAAMRLEQHAKKSARAEARKNAEQNKLIRHLQRKSEDVLADNYFNYYFENIKELKSMVKSLGWTWNEAKKTKHRHLDCFLDPSIVVWLDACERTTYKNMFKKHVPFLFVRDFVQRVYWHPTLDDILDFLQESAILLKDPDHAGLAGIHFSKEQYEDNGKQFDCYIVTFSMDS